MTVLGKVLVFAVLFLSLAWNALVVNAYVTRTNWKAELEKAQARAAQLDTSARGLRDQLLAERDAADDAKRVLREDRDRLAAQLDVARKEYDAVKAAADKAQVAATQQGAAVDQLQANLKSTVEQVSVLTRAVTEKEVQVNALTLAAQNAKAAQVQAELAAKDQAARAEDLARRVEELTERLRDAGTGRRGVGEARRADAPDGFRGTVRYYQRSDNLLSLTPGLDAGLQKGARLTVYRLAPQPKYLGTVRVVAVDPKEAVGRFTPAAARPAADDFPRPGDELTANND